MSSEDRITWVSPAWLEFAQQNGAGDLTSEAVLGQPLLSFVVGAEVREIYRLVFEQVRRTGRNIVLPFRCDGPSVRRFMELEISPRPDGDLELIGRLVRQEARGVVAVLASLLRRRDRHLTVCSWCKRFDLAGQWLEVEEVVRRLGVFEDAVPMLTHGLCPDCRERIRLEADQLATGSGVGGSARDT